MTEANHPEGTPTEEVFDFSKLDPHDGFKIHRCLVGDVSLHLTIRCQDELINPSPDPDGATVELVRWGSVEDQVSLGQADRIQMVLEAIARYLTVGGDMATLERALAHVKRLTPDGFCYPGWHYHSGQTLYDPDADAIVVQHIFVANIDEGELTPAVVWVENSFIDQTTLGEMARAEEKGFTGIDAAAATGGRQEATLQLPPPEDPDGSEQSDGNPPL